MNFRRLMGAAFLMSVALYAVVVFVLLQQPGVPAADEATLRLLTVVFYMGSAACLLTALVLVRRLRIPGIHTVAFALCEVPAILGLVHALMARTPKDFSLLASSSAVFILYFMFRKG
jgi:hypothetical protein